MQKTRRLLVEALGSLLHEKRYDAIVVQEVLDRANVGRSTFYAHFHDKDDLLLHSIRDVLRATAPAAPASARHCDRILRFSRPMFEHIAEHMRRGKTGMGIRSRALVHERLRQALAEQVAEELGNEMRSLPSKRVPRELLVQHVTSSFVLVLNWWVDSRCKLSPTEVDEMFRALVVPSLAAALE